MNKGPLPDEISYERWVSYVFDHPVLPKAWWWHDEESEYYESWNEETNPVRTLQFLTRLFREPDELRGRFSAAQIDQGLNLLVSSSCGSYMFCLHDTAIPWEARQACIEAMIPLYERLMGPVYDSPGTNNFACYIWWDVIPLHGGMDHPDRDRINNAVIHVFEAMATTRSPACLESVLHGLGHWHLYLPNRTEPIVDRILARRDLTKEQRHYAKLARRGMVQ